MTVTNQIILTMKLKAEQIQEMLPNIHLRTIHLCKVSLSGKSPHHRTLHQTKKKERHSIFLHKV
jgi:hypothetical protein